MAQGWAPLIYFYLGTQRKLLTKALKAGWSVTDIRDGRDLPLGTHPPLQASVGYVSGLLHVSCPTSGKLLLQKPSHSPKDLCQETLIPNFVSLLC